MHYLIDTHTLIWFIDKDQKISEKAKSIIKNPDLKIGISIASFWEIAIKLSLQKIQLNEPLAKVIKKTRELEIEILELQTDYILKIENLPFHHKDPFDRIIISTAITEQVPIISIDENFDKYNVERIW